MNDKHREVKDMVNNSISWFNNYYNSFGNLTEQQQKNFGIKAEHSKRVAKTAFDIASKLQWQDEDIQLAFISGLLHDVGRFSQLVEYNTFNDDQSVDHALQSVKVLQQEKLIDSLGNESSEIIFDAIRNHNKFSIDSSLKGRPLMHSRMLRDADKLDILKVLSEYYIQRNGQANHTLTWELPKGNAVSHEVAKEVLAGKMVSKKNVASEMDVKIMQLSWVFDLNYKPSFELLSKSRYLEVIYSSLPKNDLIIEIYRKIKVYTENRILMKHDNKVYSASNQ